MEFHLADLVNIITRKNPVDYYREYAVNNHRTVTVVKLHEVYLLCSFDAILQGETFYYIRPDGTWIRGIKK